MVTGNESDPSRGEVRRLVQAGGNLAGAAVGSFAALISGEPVGAAMLGAGLASVVGEIAERALSDRQRQRVGAVIEYAAASFMAQIMQGEDARDDGFWDGERSTGEEVTEGVLLAARDEYEERKLPYLGNLLASIALHEQLDVGTAHHLIRLAESMSWLELQVLAVVADHDEWPFPEREPTLMGNQEWSVYTVQGTLIRLRNDRGLVGGTPTTTERRSLRVTDLRLSALDLTSRGHLLVDTMQLWTIPRRDLKPIYAALVREPGSEEVAIPRSL